MKKEQLIIKSPPLMVLSTDWHLDKNNTSLIRDLVIEKCEFVKSLGLERVYVLGDLMDSRKGQELVVIDTLLDIFEIITKVYDLEVFVIPGNHDKVSYQAEASYIAPFQYMDGVHYVGNYSKVKEEGANIYLLPFFEEETWTKYYNEMLIDFPLSKTKKNILLTHTAFSNSINNDGSKISSKIDYSLLGKWDLVLSGHYHNLQQPFKNTFHIPSIRQKDFGEDGEKGFTVLAPDLSMQTKVASFPKYITEKVDLSTQSFSDVKNKAVELRETYANVRVVVEGPIELVQAFDAQELEGIGIRVKKKNPEIDTSMEFAETCDQIEELTQEKILVEFESFCEKENISFEEGVKYLKV